MAMVSGISAAWAFPDKTDIVYQRLEQDIQQAIDRLIIVNERIDTATQQTGIADSENPGFNSGAGETAVMDRDTPENTITQLQDLQKLQDQRLAILDALRVARRGMLLYVQKKYATELTRNTRIGESLVARNRMLEDKVMKLRDPSTLTHMPYSVVMDNMHKFTEELMKTRQSYYLIARINHTALQEVIEEINAELVTVDSDFIKDKAVSFSVNRYLRDTIKALQQGKTFTEVRGKVFAQLNERFMGPNGVSARFTQRVMRAEEERQKSELELRKFQEKGIESIRLKNFPLPEDVTSSAISDKKINDFMENALKKTVPIGQKLPDVLQSPKRPPQSPSESPPTIPFRPKPR